MGAGQYRERLTFQRRTQATNDLGGAEGGWADICTVAARMAPIAPRKGNPEQVMAMRLTGIILFEVTIRSSKIARTIGPDCRAVNTRTGVPYNVRSDVNVDEKNRELTLLCESGVAQ